MSSALLRRISPDQVTSLRRDPVDAEALSVATQIVDDVRRRGEVALREHAERYDGLLPGQPLVIERTELLIALDALAPHERGLLDRTADRIRRFAAAQRHCLQELTCAIPGGAAGHTIAPVEAAGCYAPGGRFPLPSSVLMTVIPARVAGVETVWVASPQPTAVTLAAAALAGADALLCAGGAHAIAALAYGAGPVPPCDAVVGPGSRWVTAAKQLVAGRVAIDMLAGPSELVVLADHSADAALVAADLLAQAEHDADARPLLVTTSEPLADATEQQLARQLVSLPTAETARAALSNGLSVVANDLPEAVRLCDRIAPEHLALHVADAQAVAARVRHYGSLFVGAQTAEVLGDYGAGPNHVLPTGGTARSTGGLSVLTFLRVRTWLRIDDSRAAAGLYADAMALARLETLEAHARSAIARHPGLGS
jgi:phosphoribosyl-ATP pyrophosphohydrolase/phosphoribosyl-AMP cyclohydrolase/histidinol dehydrogenase